MKLRSGKRIKLNEHQACKTPHLSEVLQEQVPGHLSLPQEDQIFKLSAELLCEEILSKLSLGDKVRCMSVCKAFRKYLEDTWPATFIVGSSIRTHHLEIEEDKMTSYLVLFDNKFNTFYKTGKLDFNVCGRTIKRMELIAHTGNYLLFTKSQTFNDLMFVIWNIPTGNVSIVELQEGLKIRGDSLLAVHMLGCGKDLKVACIVSEGGKRIAAYVYYFHTECWEEEKPYILCTHAEPGLNRLNTVGSALWEGSIWKCIGGNELVEYQVDAKRFVLHRHEVNASCQFVACGGNLFSITSSRAVIGRLQQNQIGRMEVHPIYPGTQQEIKVLGACSDGINHIWMACTNNTEAYWLNYDIVLGTMVKLRQPVFPVQNIVKRKWGWFVCFCKIPGLKPVVNVQV